MQKFKQKENSLSQLVVSCPCNRKFLQVLNPLPSLQKLFFWTVFCGHQTKTMHYSSFCIHRTQGKIKISKLIKFSNGTWKLENKNESPGYLQFTPSKILKIFANFQNHHRFWCMVWNFASQRDLFICYKPNQTRYPWIQLI